MNNKKVIAALVLCVVVVLFGLAAIGISTSDKIPTPADIATWTQPEAIFYGLLAVAFSILLAGK